MKKAGFQTRKVGVQMRKVRLIEVWYRPHDDVREGVAVMRPRILRGGVRSVLLWALVCGRGQGLGAQPTSSAYSSSGASGSKK